jgi:hypothetical protein
LPSVPLWRLPSGESFSKLTPRKLGAGLALVEGYYFCHSKCTGFFFNSASHLQSKHSVTCTTPPFLHLFCLVTQNFYSLKPFFPQHCPTSSRDMPPFYKSKIFTSSLQLSTFTCTLLWEHHLLLGGRFHKMFIKSHNLDTTDNNVGLTECFSTSTECKVCEELKCLFLNFFI